VVLQDKVECPEAWEVCLVDSQEAACQVKAHQEELQVVELTLVLMISTE
jgi:hypothetical protein